MGMSWDVLMTNTTFPTKNSELRETVRISTTPTGETKLCNLLIT